MNLSNISNFFERLNPRNYAFKPEENNPGLNPCDCYFSKENVDSVKNFFVNHYKTYRDIAESYKGALFEAAKKTPVEYYAAGTVAMVAALGVGTLLYKMSSKQVEKEVKENKEEVKLQSCKIKIQHRPKTELVEVVSASCRLAFFLYLTTYRPSVHFRPVIWF